MNRIISLTVCLFITLSASAGVQDRIQAEKVAFFTNELDLTPEEAQVFWPVYNQYSKESKEAHDNTMRLFRELNPEKGETIADSEMEKRVSAYVKALEEENSIKASYYNKFKKVLPIQKVARLYQTEETFRMRMINTLVGGPKDMWPKRR